MKIDVASRMGQKRDNIKLMMKDNVCSHIYTHQRIGRLKNEWSWSNWTLMSGGAWGLIAILHLSFLSFSKKREWCKKKWQKKASKKNVTLGRILRRMRCRFRLEGWGTSRGSWRWGNSKVKKANCQLQENVQPPRWHGAAVLNSSRTCATSEGR